jgi:hypothetical protein
MIDKITGISKYHSIITLIVSGLNTLIQRHRLAEYIGKYDPICWLQEAQFRGKDTQTERKWNNGKLLTKQAEEKNKQK